MISSHDPRPLRFAYTDTRRWVLIGAWIGTGAYTVLTAVSLVSWGWDPSRHQGMLMLAAAGCLLGAAVAHRGHVFAGGMIGLIATWSEVHFSMLMTQQFPSPSMMASATLLVAAALLLKPRDSLWFAIATIVLTWPLVLMSPGAHVPGATPTVIYWLMAHAVVTFAVWALVTLGFSIVDRAFIEVVRKERELSETIDRAPDGILVIDAAETLRVMNPAAERLLGMPRDESIGRPLADVLRAAAAHTEVNCPLAFKDSGERPYTWKAATADGGQCELEVTWRTMDEGRRQLVLRDVSDRVRAEQARRDMELQLAHAQRLEAVGQLAGGIAHDFNNILTIVGASAEVLRSELDDDRHTPLLDEILAAQERGATLTRQLLAFARREVVHPRVFDLSEHVISLQRLLQRVAGEQTRIWCDVEPDCRIRADVGQVEQALVNLVTNARDAMPDGGTCALTVKRMTNDDGEMWVRLRVRDDGMGMDQATSARAFEPFFTTKPRGRGTGLGLAAVHGMAMQSGGRAEIESLPTYGTTVILEFPFADAPTTVRVTPVRIDQTIGGGTILVAEDDDGTRSTVARILQRLGYAVLLAPDGMQALRLAEMNAGRIDLLLTDVMMPGLSGPQLAARLRAISPQVPVVFMSGYPEDALAEVEGLRVETDFVAKPFSSALLAQRISEKLGVALATGGDSSRQQ
jgi:PAS domain S-box-containing protein